MASCADLGKVMNSVALAVFAACLVATPALGQTTLSIGVGGDSGGSSATLTTTQTAPVFTGDYAGANVLTGRQCPQFGPSNGGQILGTLRQGGTVMARCQRGWCELQDGGYVGQKFLSFDASGSFDVVPATGGGCFDRRRPGNDRTTATTGTDSTTALAPPTSAGSVSANFGGDWSVTNDPSGQAVPLTLAQTGESVTGTLQGKSPRHQAHGRGRRHQAQLHLPDGQRQRRAGGDRQWISDPHHRRPGADRRADAQWPRDRQYQRCPLSTGKAGGHRFETFGLHNSRRIPIMGRGFKATIQGLKTIALCEPIVPNLQGMLKTA